jgi:hypothetical protein
MKEVVTGFLHKKTATGLWRLKKDERARLELGRPV